LSFSVSMFRTSFSLPPSAVCVTNYHFSTTRDSGKQDHPFPVLDRAFLLILTITLTRA
jgi:hypothetical protein